MKKIELILSAEGGKKRHKITGTSLSDDLDFDSEVRWNIGIKENTLKCGYDTMIQIAKNEGYGIGDYTLIMEVRGK